VVIQHVIGIPFTLYPIFIYKSTTFFSILPEHFLGFYQLSILEFEMFSAQEADIEERKGSLLLVFRVTSCCKVVALQMWVQDAGIAGSTVL
jgi:hypothetical protein